MTSRAMEVWDDLPDWIKTVTDKEDFDKLDPVEVLSKLNFLKGAYQGFRMRVAELEDQLEEADEKFDLARDYQRQLDIQKLEDTLRVLDNAPAATKQGLKVAIETLNEEG